MLSSGASLCLIEPKENQTTEIESKKYKDDQQLSNQIHERILKKGKRLYEKQGRIRKSRAGGQGPYLRSADYLGRYSEVKEIKS